MSTYAASDQMLSTLTDSELNFTKLTESDAGATLQTGIYYIDADLTLKGNSTHKNGLAVAENATVYLYIPTGKILTVIGANGTPAQPAGGGDEGTMTLTEYWGQTDRGTILAKLPGNLVKSEASTPVIAENGGGAAIYVPSGANLVVLGDGELIAKGGNGNAGSYGATGVRTIYWNFSVYAKKGDTPTLTNHTVHQTNEPAYDSFEVSGKCTSDKEDCWFSLTTLLGAGGTGGNGAGGGGTAIGTNGANGAKGAKGADGPAVQDTNDAVAPNAKKAKTNKTTADQAGNIYIANTVKTDQCTPGTGGEKDDTKLEAADFSDKEPVTLKSYHTYTAGKPTNSGASYTPIDITMHLTKARMGGNGGAGGTGATFGSGGTGGGGGGGGESASMTHPWHGSTTYYTDTTYPGEDGDDATNDTAASVDPVFDATDTANTGKLPYNTVAFKTSTATSAVQNYYLDGTDAENKITVPGSAGVTVPYGKKFVGWKITKAATAALNTVNATAFTTAPNDELLKTYSTTNKVYEEGDTIIATGIYGDVELEAVFEPKPTNAITFEPAAYKQSIKDNGEDGGDITEAWDGQSVEVTAKARTGYDFAGFEAKDANGGTVTVTPGSGNTGTFTMPACAVTVTAKYTAQTRKVKPVDCQVNNSTSEIDADVGTTVSISAPADKLHTTGEDFTGYAITKTEGGTDAGVTITYDPTDNTKASFTMPAYDVTVTAKYEPHDFDVHVVNNTCTVTVTADGAANAQNTARKGNTVKLTAANAPDGQHFDRFVVRDAENGNEISGLTVTTDESGTAPTGTFPMPAQDVWVEALYSASDYTVTADGCSIDVTDASGTTTKKDTASAQMYNQIVVKAPEPQTGDDFKGFALNPDVDDAQQDLDARTVTFTMPASGVTVTTSYEPHDYEIELKDGITVTVKSGTLKTDPVTGKITATYGTEIYLTQGSDAPEGKEFTGFSVTDEGGNTVLTHDYDHKTYFEMPASNVTVKAEYDKKHYAIKVNNGTFTVDGVSDKTTATKDQTITLTPDDRTDEGLEFDEWTVVKGDITIVNDQFTMPAGEVEITAKYKKKGYGIDADNTSVTVKDAEGNEKTGEPNAGDKVEIVADDRTEDGYAFRDFTVTKSDGSDVALLPGADQSRKSFTMPADDVKVKANYDKLDYIVSVGSRGSFTLTPAEDSTTQGGSYTGPTNAQVKDSIVFTTDGPGEDERFAGWAFTLGSQTVEWADVQKYVQAGDENSLTITIAMPPKNLTATPVYKPIVGNAIVFENGCGFARVEGQMTTAANENDEVTIRAAAEEGLLFDYWEMFYGTDPDAEDWADITDRLASKTSAETTFTMPDGPVTLRAHYILASADPGTDMISKGEAAGKSVAAAAAAVGVGIAVWQGSELAMRIYRNKIIQIDYWPGNRIALAQLIWSRAGSPEPGSDVPFADITEALDTLNDTNINAQKAARWCVEQGLLDAKTADDGTECFEPMKHVTHLRVCLTWQNARKMGLFEVPAETE